MKTLLAILLAFSLSYADDIKFKSGGWLKNVMVTDTTEGRITVKFINETHHYPLNTIAEVIKSTYDPTKPSPYFPAEQVEANPELGAVGINAGREYPNLKLLPISIIAFGLSYDFFQTASDIGDSPDPNGIKSRKTILGIICLGAGIANAVISFQSVEVKATPNSLTLSYRF